MDEASLPISEVAESVTKGESLIETTQIDLAEGASDEQSESSTPKHESEPTDAEVVLDGSLPSVMKEDDVASVEPTSISGDVVIDDSSQTIEEFLPSSSTGAPEVTVNNSDGEIVAADVDVSTSSASPVESSIAVSTEHSPETSRSSSSQPDTPNVNSQEITSTQDMADVVDEGSESSREEARVVVAENESSVEAIPTDANSATQAPTCDISPSSSSSSPVSPPTLATVTPTPAQEELSAAVDEALAEVDLDDAMESGPSEDPNIDVSPYIVAASLLVNSLLLSAYILVKRCGKCDGLTYTVFKSKWQIVNLCSSKTISLKTFKFSVNVGNN
ncbi:MAG: hypothetical protein VX367_01335 [SAR324 cluster bacterium]|nr:hypothetical protein [SAR324 cluster bacterium]